MDAEGSFEKWKKPHTNKIFPRIRFCCKSRDVIDWISKEMEDLRIDVSEIWYSSKVFRFQIAKKNSVYHFINDIGFRYPTKRPGASYDGKG